jgi:hypothetical protein
MINRVWRQRPSAWVVVLVDSLVPVVCCGTSGFLASTAVKQWGHDRSSAIVAAVLSALCLLASYWLVWLRESSLRRAARQGGPDEPR